MIQKDIFCFLGFLKFQVEQKKKQNSVLWIVVGSDPTVLEGILGKVSLTPVFQLCFLWF